MSVDPDPEADDVDDGDATDPSTEADDRLLDWVLGSSAPREQPAGGDDLPTDAPESGDETPKR